MVTGELNPRLALLVSAALLVISGVITWFYLQPVAVLFLAGGVLLNILYEYAKARGILGNLVFGLMITMAPLYGGYASGPTAATVFQPNRISVLLLVLVMNALMTYYTYFKDYRGDLLAGKRTLVVALWPGEIALDRRRLRFDSDHRLRRFAGDRPAPDAAEQHVHHPGGADGLSANLDRRALLEEPLGREGLRFPGNQLPGLHLRAGGADRHFQPGPGDLAVYLLLHFCRIPV